MENNNNYGNFLKQVTTEKERTTTYLKEKENHLLKAQEMLKVKELELENAQKYYYLLMNVIQALKTEIRTTELEIKEFQSELQAAHSYEQSVSELVTTVSDYEKSVAIGNLSQAHKPEMHISLKSLNEMKEQSDELSTISDDEDEEEEVKNETAETVAEVNEAKTVEDEDANYLKLITEHCKLPDDDKKLEIWNRRVLVKHYLESGLSTTKSILSRYNAYAKKYNASFATESSISKDIRLIFLGQFNLEVLTYDKSISSKFTPSSMLTGEEIKQINQMILDMSAQSKNKTTMINKIKNYAMNNMRDMSVYKVDAIRYFVNEQLSN